MYVSLRVTQAPASEPVALEETKRHLRVDDASDDDLIKGMITAARMFLEQWTGRAFITQTLLWTMSQSVPQGALPLLPMPLLILPIILSAPQRMNRPLELPRGPVQSVESVVWMNTDGTTYPLTAGTDYFADIALDPARVRLTWLTIPRYLEHIQISFVAGFGNGFETVPNPLRQAIKMMVAWLYEHRGDDAQQVEMPKAVEYLITPFRLQFPFA